MFSGEGSMTPREIILLIFIVVNSFIRLILEDNLHKLVLLMYMYQRGTPNNLSKSNFIKVEFYQSKILSKFF